MENSAYILSKDKLKSFLKAAMEDFCLVTPQPAAGGDFLFQETSDLESINLDYDITSNTLKEFFFPAREAIFKYQKAGNSFKVTPAKERFREETIFFGVRSCDVRAVHFCDLFFSQEPKDTLYWRKRQKAVLVTFACNKPPRHTCFCLHTKNSGPVLEKGEGFDLQFIDLAKTYLVEVGTEQGGNLIKRYKRFFSEAGGDMQDKKACLKAGCLRHFSSDYDIMRVYDKLKKANLEGLWEELGKRCTDCGGCEFICPTCFCFYTQDINHTQNEGERIRAWDSCVFEGYGRMSGGISPHEKNADRVKRRFFCKLYNCYNWFGLFACTGCGRCAFVCPVNLDMESFIASLMQDNIYQPLLREL